MQPTENNSVRRATTLSTLAKALVQTIDERGLDAADLVQRSGMDPEILERPGGRVRMSAMTKLWKLAVEETGDDTLGLSAARRIQPASNHALGLAWLASSTLREALTRLVRFHRVLSTGMSMQLETKSDSLDLVLHPGEHGEMVAREAIEAFFSIVVIKCRMLMGSNFHPAAVYLMRPQPQREDPYVEALGVVPHFLADRNAISFYKNGLDEPLPAGDPELASELDSISERYLTSMDPNAITAGVRDILEDIMPSGRPTLAAVSRLMNRSTKTVQRGLNAERTSFHQILEQTRLSLALKYVRDGELSLSHIAQLLGFSDQSNFTRAFKRWTRQSPGNYRNSRSG
ncbi:MAG: AraC family transcriptional regulator [Gammaproteobacteria bacterium]